MIGTCVNLFGIEPLFPYQTLVEIERSQEYGRLYFHDFNKDGRKERVRIGKQYQNSFYILLDYDHQFNAFGNLPIKSSPAFGDYNDNGIDEIFFASYLNDSVFINGYEYYREDEPVINSFFIDRVETYNGEEDFVLSIDARYDFDGDGYKELLVGIQTLYNYSPRRYYLINLKSKAVTATPVSGAWKQSYEVLNLDDDPYPEFLTWGYAPGNTPLNFPLHDHWSWLIMYDHDLNYLEDPIPYKQRPGSLNFWNIDGDTLEIILQSKADSLTKAVRILKNGQAIDTTIITNSDYTTLYSNQRTEAYKIDTEAGVLYLLNRHTEKTQYSLPAKSALLYSFDADCDLRDEHIVSSSDELYIHTFDFKESVLVPIPKGELRLDPNILPFSVNCVSGSPAQISLNYPDHFYLFDYETNKFTQFKWAIFLLAYIALFGIARLVIRYRELKEASLDYEYLLLQVNSLKNQLDPHFTFNLLGSIRTILETGERSKALEIFDKLGLLLRSSLVDSDKIEAPLSSELTSVTTYLELQRFRFGESFDFKITVDESVPDDLLVPKLLIQTHVENSIKHGIKSLKHGGRIDVRVSPCEEGVEILIADNGIGRKNSQREGTRGTGKGIKITYRLIQLFNDVYSTSVHQHISDHPYPQPPNVGTLVRVFIPHP
ncbi:MAG: histidine kinase [Imperialibacter sp.]|uniref:histidine kinase n=1 Tax=Imperialibacter sp. TaxID=2038411 RepID=UPI0032EBBAC9